MILVIDDNEDSLRIISRILQKSGFEVVVERNGKDGLARARETLPEVVILDIMMPEMTGIEVLEQLRASPPTSQVPVIVLSAKAQDQDLITGYQTGADYYVTKPFTSSQLLYGVKLVLGKGSS
jgi:DNA-binding response OmpR family regulator